MSHPLYLGYSYDLGEVVCPVSEFSGSTSRIDHCEKSMHFQCNGNFDHVTELSSVLGDILILYYLLEQKDNILINHYVVY